MKQQLYLILCLHALYFQISLADSSEENHVNDVASQELEMDKKIYGGVTVGRTQYPFVARLRVKYRVNGDVFCSGVVLTDKIILTVAHCVSRPGGEKAESVWARLQTGGIYKFSRNEIIIHPSFNKIYGCDFAVLRKDTSTVYMKEYGTPPSLPQDLGTAGYTTYTNEPAVIVGWGKTSDREFFNYPRLQAADVIFSTDTDQCTNEYPFVYSSMYDTDRLLCTVNNIAGICVGDWGGPLLVGGKVVGLAIFRAGSCDNQNSASSAFTDVQSAAQWLRTTFNLK